MNKDILKYIRKTLFLTLPFICFVGLYIYIDPFLVIKHYDNYYLSRNGNYSLNHGFISTQNLANHYPDYQWDSYIFGNSRSRNWKISDWKQYLEPGCKGYHFDAHSETLLGIAKKIEYLDSKDINIKNALIIVDRSLLGVIKSSKEHAYMIAPQLVDNSNFWSFHFENFYAFANYKFLNRYVSYQPIPKDQLTLEDIVSGECGDYDYSTNEISQNYAEEWIEQGKYYTEELYHRQFEGLQNPGFIPYVCIKEPQERLLNEINGFFKKHNTNCRVVISPLYDQSTLSAKDIETLKRIFGEDKVFDFSGVNDFTSDYHNYYERSHYRPHVAAQMLEEIYDKR